MMKNILTLLLLAFSVSLFAQQEAYSVVDNMPHYKACMDRDNDADKRACAEREMMTFVNSHADFSKISAKSDATSAIVRFVVNPDGTLSDAFLDNRKGEFSKEAEDAVKSIFADMPIWTPGSMKGRKVPVALAIPIRL